MRMLTALLGLSVVAMIGCSETAKPVVKYQTVVLKLARDTVLERNLAAAIELAKQTCVRPSCGTAAECYTLVTHQNHTAYEIYAGSDAEQVESRKRFLVLCHDHYVKQYEILQELEPLRAARKR